MLRNFQVSYLRKVSELRNLNVSKIRNLELLPCPGAWKTSIGEFVFVLIGGSTRNLLICGWRTWSVVEYFLNLDFQLFLAGIVVKYVLHFVKNIIITIFIHIYYHLITFYSSLFVIFACVFHFDFRSELRRFRISETWRSRMLGNSETLGTRFRSFETYCIYGLSRTDVYSNSTGYTTQ